MFVIDQSLSGYPELSQGDTGADVRCLEYCLHILNCYGGAFDGIFGPEVNAATKQFQVRHALSVDGVVGPQTWGSIIPRITEIQIALNAAGISVEVDGLGGPQTLNGVINFQESAQVVDSGEGYVGPITREVMFGGSSCIDISGYPELSQGNTGADVRCLEYCLHILNCYAGAFDGIFGPEVFNAAEQLQERNYIGVDGIVGPQTWGVIIPRIKEIQVALNATGASLQVDGLGGPETLQAVINFQNASGFNNPQGYVGPETRNVLFGTANEENISAPNSGTPSNSEPGSGPENASWSDLGFYTKLGIFIGTFEGYLPNEVGGEIGYSTNDSNWSGGYMSKSEALQYAIEFVKDNIDYLDNLMTANGMDPNKLSAQQKFALYDAGYNLVGESFGQLIAAIMADNFSNPTSGTFTQFDDNGEGNLEQRRYAEWLIYTSGKVTFWDTSNYYSLPSVYQKMVSEGVNKGETFLV